MQRRNILECTEKCSKRKAYGNGHILMYKHFYLKNKLQYKTLVHLAY